MPQQRHQLTIVAPQDGQIGRPDASVDCDGRRVVVEAAQAAVGIALDVGGVGGAPVQPGRKVAEQVKGRAAERIAAFDRIGAGRDLARRRAS